MAEWCFTIRNTRNVTWPIRERGTSAIQNINRCHNTINRLNADKRYLKTIWVSYLPRTYLWTKLSFCSLFPGFPLLLNSTFQFTLTQSIFFTQRTIKIITTHGGEWKYLFPHALLKHVSTNIHTNSNFLNITNTYPAQTSYLIDAGHVWKP